MLSEQTDAHEIKTASGFPQHGFEASLAPREGDLLSLPFDQYGRMRVAQNIAHFFYSAVASHAGSGSGGNNGSGGEGEGQGEGGRKGEENAGPYRLRVLDVGGYPGILRHFLSGDYFDLSVVDVVPDDGSIPGYTQGSGLGLPYADGSFDVVFSLDTLEHIPGRERDHFLSELKRVARLGAVLINPIQSVQADLAEETLDEYIRWILGAQQEQLAEHRAYGLPDFAATEQAFSMDGWRTHTFHLANVYNWLFMMIAKHYLISMRDEKASAFERTLDRFYNLTFFENDRTDPAYRGVVVAVKPGLDTVLEQVYAAYPPVPTTDASNAVRLQLAEVLMGLLNLKVANHEDRLLRDQMEARDKHIAEMETQVATQDIALDRRRVDIEALKTHSVNLEDALTVRHADVASLNEQIARLQSEQSDTVSRLQVERDQIGIERDRMEVDRDRRAIEVDLLSTRIERLEDARRALETHVGNIQAAYTAEFANQKAYIGRLEGDLKAKDEHIIYLEKLLQGIHSGRVFQLTRLLSRFLGRH